MQRFNSRQSTNLVTAGSQQSTRQHFRVGGASIGDKPILFRHDSMEKNVRSLTHLSQFDFVAEIIRHGKSIQSTITR